MYREAELREKDGQVWLLMPLEVLTIYELWSRWRAEDRVDEVGRIHVAADKK